MPHGDRWAQFRLPCQDPKGCTIMDLVNFPIDLAVGDLLDLYDMLGF